MSWSTALDTALDRVIAPGYGNLGLQVRRRLPDWPGDPPRMDGKVVLITGAASGIGTAAAVGFARLGASVRALGRDQARAESAREEIVKQAPEADVRPVACDLGSLAAIREFVSGFTAEEARLDVLVNNAGVMPEQRTRSADGHELMFATHVLAPFALTALLEDLLRRSAPARVINVTSGGLYGQSLPGEDIESEGTEYSPKRLYARTKREQMVITEQWAEQLRDRGVVVHAMHPGWVDTEGVRRWMPRFRALTRPILRTSAEGADTIVWLGGADEPLTTTGRLWQDRRARPVNYRLGPGPDSEADRRLLWDRCVAAVEQ